MVGIGHRAPVGTTTLRELTAGGAPDRPQRLDEHVLLLVTAGHGSHAVDFTAYPCRPGTLIWARPGQVISYGRQPGLDATVVRWHPDALAPLGGYPSLAGPAPTVHWQLAGEDEDAVINEVSQLVVDCRRHRAGEIAADLLRHQLAVLALRLSSMGGGLGTGILARFLRDVEANFAHCRRVEEYAARLGCSVRTLTRACLAATGRAAKQVIDDRAALEARRLLACTDLPVAEIGHRLGFAEPTNFGRFFQREAGLTPGAFRTAQQGYGRIPAQRSGLDT